jgi:pyruvate dehydrogenase E2 component (dihydrolipoyllysine-residue acetyltransferase)
MADFILPELGENVTAGDVLRVLVKPGDTLAKDQAVLELETDKATIEVPSNVAGRVTSVAVKAGDKVQVGQVVLSVEGGEGAAAKPVESRTESEAGAANTSSKAPVDGLEPPSEGTQRTFQTDKSRKKEKPAAQEAAETPDQESVPTERARQAPAAAPTSNVVAISRATRPVPEPAASDTPPAPASPSVRRMARELGVDVDRVQGSGPDGRISIDDVKARAKQLIDSAARGQTPATEAPPDFSRWGEVDRQPMHGVRRKTAEHLSAAWRAIPHVTQHGLADITSLEELRKKYAKDAEAAGGSLTITAIAAKVVAAGMKSFPQFNASIDMAAQEIIYKKYVHIGVAVDTERGLLVPVVRDADAKNIIQIAVEISALSTKARARKLTLEEMQGGCFSISNLGGFGGTYFTPIVNLPEVAILGIGRARIEPIYKDDQFVPRLMLPLSLSYDHRVIDGADGIRFLQWIIQALEQPFLLALQG